MKKTRIRERRRCAVAGEDVTYHSTKSPSSQFFPLFSRVRFCRTVCPPASFITIIHPVVISNSKTYEVVVILVELVCGNLLTKGTDYVSVTRSRIPHTYCLLFGRTLLH